jgi:hydrogenase maturation protein HypF
MAGLAGQLPRQARIGRLEEIGRGMMTETEAGASSGEFRILASASDASSRVTIPADLAMCAACAAELAEPGDRRYGYPFITCTDCGPRYTVVTGMPYDRERTTLAAFPLCADCRREYEDPSDRRCHAESIACPVCGPQVFLADRDGRRTAAGRAALAGARAALSSGEIVAIRGIGGFLLACDAANAAAVGELRRRKCRPHKPLAVMVRSVEVLVRDLRPSAEALRLLCSSRAPIVILDTPSGADFLPLGRLSPDTATLGVMLPYSPLHRLLFDPSEPDGVAFDYLVMTSGNRRSEPICRTNAEAFSRLGDIADLWLCHDREIQFRCDDSVCAMQEDGPQVWRRARGYAPRPVRLARPLVRSVLALGAELKSTVAFGHGDEVVLSPHVGDLETPEAVAGLEAVIAALPRFLGREPEVIAVDRHPDMASSRLGRALAEARGLPLVLVQHHHAHAAAALAEHGLDAGIALVFDGVGLGLDGALWGAECMLVDASGFRRLASFASVPLPGGDAAVRRPVRQLVARLAVAGVGRAAIGRCCPGVMEAELDAWLLQVCTGLNAPPTHAAGRLFDAVAVLLGVAPEAVSYEGQAAIRLEAAAVRAVAPTSREMAFVLRRDGDLLLVDWSPLVAALAMAGMPSPGDVPGLALGFHRAVAEAAVAMVVDALGRFPGCPVVLTGGVFMNRLLTRLVRCGLAGQGIAALIPREIPPNDGCVAFGQAVVAGR